MNRLHFFVAGIPAPQGSKSAYVRGGRAVVVEGGSKTGRDKHKAWRAAVTDTASEARDGHTFNGPVSVDLHFVMPRPKSVRRAYPAVKPDLDKLIRSTLDGLTDAQVWTDDALAIELTALKVYTVAGNGPGAYITIGRWGRQ